MLGETPERISALKTCLRSRSDANDFDELWDARFLHCSVDRVLLLAELVAPAFFEHDSMLFRSEARMYASDGKTIEETIDAFLRSGRSRQEAQQTFNRADLELEFADRDVLTTNDLYEWAAELIAECWRGRLAVAYPQRRFEVEVFAVDGGSMHCCVTFFELE